MQVFISNYNYHNYRVILECWEKYGQKNEKKEFITSMVNLFFFSNAKYSEGACCFSKVQILNDSY